MKQKILMSKWYNPFLTDFSFAKRDAEVLALARTTNGIWKVITEEKSSSDNSLENFLELVAPYTIETEEFGGTGEEALNFFSKEELETEDFGFWFDREYSIFHIIF